MSIDKFLSLLTENKLYFPNVTLFNDRYEGKLSFDSLEEVSKSHLLNDYNTPVKQDKYYKEYKKFLFVDADRLNINDIELFSTYSYTFDSLLSKFSNHLMFCSCWFMNDNENHSMWSEYGDKIHPTSIAIKTTIKALKDSIQSDCHHIHIGEVKYKNYKKDHIKGYEKFSSERLTDHDTMLKLFYAPVMHKRNIYQDEHEVRAIISFEYICKKFWNDVYTSQIPFYSDRLFDQNYYILDFNKGNMMKGVPEGISIDINIQTLINRIYTSPNAKIHFRRSFEKLVDKYNIDPSKVFPSEI